MTSLLKFWLEILLESKMSQHSKALCFFVFLSTSYLSKSQEANLLSVIIDPLTGYISTDPNDVAFYLYPNSNDITDNDKLIYMDKTSIQKSRFNRSNPIILLVHGFIQNYTSEFPVCEKNAYLAAGYASHSNIIAVDWGKLSGTLDFKNLTSDLASYPSYVKAASNVYIVGERIRDFLVFLTKNGYISNPEAIHMIGQSLGAHISGMAGYYFKQRTSISIGRITGTDPAAPSFEGIDKSRRLDSTDATFVDIVHTNRGEFGYLGTLGDVDFFLNGGGPLQPDCRLNVTDVVCAHNLAPRLFLKSIPDPTIKACSHPFYRIDCDSSDEIIFGEHCPTSARGTYYLDLELDD